MDQNIIRLTKLYYRTSLLASIIAKPGEPSTLLKNLTLKDAVINLHHAWNRLEQGTIAKCWKPLLYSGVNVNTSEDDIPLSILRDQWNLEFTVAASETLQTLNNISNTEV